MSIGLHKGTDMQENSQVSTTPPLSGVDLVDQVNKALQTIGTNFSGSDDPASIAWPYSTWADTANNLLKRRNSAGTAWVVEGVLLTSHVPSLLPADIPATDIGAIYVVGVGMMTWDGAQYRSDQATGIVRTGGFKNLLINSNFAVNQRNASGTVTLAAGAYGHDRWKAGSGGCTYTFSSTGGITTLNISSGTLMQVIEGANLRSGTNTLSWVGSAQGRIGSGSYGASGVTASVAGGSNLSVEFGVGTVSTPQFERGETPSSYEFRPIATELSLCQRYYEISGGQFGYTNPGNNATVIQYLSTKFAVPKRAAPTISRGVVNGTVVVQVVSAEFVTWNFQNSGSVNNIWSWVADAEL